VRHSPCSFFGACSAASLYQIGASLATPNLGRVLSRARGARFLINKDRVDRYRYLSDSMSNSGQQVTQIVKDGILFGLAQLLFQFKKQVQGVHRREMVDVCLTQPVDNLL